MIEPEFYRLLKENLHDVYAVKFCVDLIYVAHLWDDLIDRDKERSSADISEAFRKCLYEIPSNPFFQRHSNELLPLMSSAMLQWMDSVKLERGTEDEKHLAYILRNGLSHVFHYCVHLSGADRSQMEAYRKREAEGMATIFNDLMGELGNG